MDFTERVEATLSVVGRLAVLVVAAAATMFVLGVLLKPVLPLGLPAGAPGRILMLVLIAMSLGVGHLAVVVAMERSSWRAVGLGASGWHPVRLLMAAAVGAAAIALTGGLLLLSGDAHLAAAPGVGGPAHGEVAMLLLAQTLVEALAFRGYLLGLLEQRWGAAWAIGLSSLVAGVYHAFDPRALPATLLGAIAVGALLATLRLRLRSLAGSWLAHVAMVCLSVFVFRSAARGQTLLSGGARWVSDGAPWWTGGTWGLDGGVAAATVLAVVTFLCLRWMPGPRVSES